MGSAEDGPESTEASPQAAESPPSVDVRLGVYRRSGEERRPLAMLCVSGTVVGEVGLSLHDALSEEEAATIKEMMTGLVRTTWQGLTEPRALASFVMGIQRSLAGANLEHEVLPSRDYRFQILASDNVLTGSCEPLHPFAKISDQTLASLRSNMMQVFKVNPSEVLQVVHQCVAAGAHAEAVAAVRDSGRYLKPDFALFKALREVRAEVLSADDRAYLLHRRWQAACAARQFVAAAEDATELLRTSNLPPEDALSLRTTQAVAAHESGRNETAIAILREILASPGLTDVQKGWALKNLATFLGGDHEEFSAHLQSSAVAFLAAGMRVEAASSLLTIVNKKLFKSPADALSMLDEIETWFDAAEPLSQELRAGLLHLRGDALRRLRRPEEALAAAKTAVELRRGPMFVEEHLASSLSLAMYAAEDLGRTDEAEAYNREAEQIEAKLLGEQPSLDQRVIDLARNYDPEVGAAVVKQAQEVGDSRVAANAMMLMATSDPRLSPVDRLDLLERAVEELKHCRHSDDEDRASAYLVIAFELTRQKQYDRALDWYKKVHDINPLTDELCPNYPVLLLEKERWPDLAAFAADQIERSGETVEMLYFHGRALAGLDQPEQALRPLVRAQRLATEHPLAPKLAEWIARVADASPPPETTPRAGRSPARPTVRKVLFAAASPAELGRLNFDVEFRKISNETRDASLGFEMVPVLAARQGDLERALLDHHPAIFHYAGHATDSGLLLQDDVEAVREASYDWLATALAAIGGIECVVLNACQTLAGATKLSRVARYVIGLPKPWGDRAAVEFAHAFYLAASRATPVLRAFEVARERVASLGVPRDDLPRLVQYGMNRS